MAKRTCSGEQAEAVSHAYKRPKEVAVASKYFDGCTSGYFGRVQAPLKISLPPTLSTSPTPPATLLLGSQASDNSIARAEAFASNENAFWHILGDALGFARGFHHKGRVVAVDSIAPHLLHASEGGAGGSGGGGSSILSVEDMVAASSGQPALPESRVLGYDAAVRTLVAARFAIWDVVGASERSGSCDEAITNPLHNDVRSLVNHVPSIRRLCFVTGVGSAKLFRKAWRGWLATPGAFTVASDRASQEVFGKIVPPLPEHPTTTTTTSTGPSSSSSAAPASMPQPPPLPCLPAEQLAQTPHPVAHPIELVVLESVSPAHVPLTAAKSNAKRIAAYRAEGRHDLLCAGADGKPPVFAPRASAYAWKRAMWLASPAFDDVPAGLLHPAASAVLPFGTGADGRGRPQDFVPE